MPGILSPFSVHLTYCCMSFSMSDAAPVWGFGHFSAQIHAFQRSFEYHHHLRCCFGHSRNRGVVNVGLHLRCCSLGYTCKARAKATGAAQALCARWWTGPTARRSKDWRLLCLLRSLSPADGSVKAGLGRLFAHIWKRCVKAQTIFSVTQAQKRYGCLRSPVGPFAS